MEASIKYGNSVLLSGVLGKLKHGKCLEIVAESHVSETLAGHHLP